jgi:hypothetical protein
MINKVLNVNSANRVEKPKTTEPVLKNTGAKVFDKDEKNRIIFNTAQKIMSAGTDILPLNPQLSAILLEFGNQKLDSIDLSDNKMTEDEVQSIIDDILKMKEVLNDQ